MYSNTVCLRARQAGKISCKSRELGEFFKCCTFSEKVLENTYCYIYISVVQISLTAGKRVSILDL